MKTIHSFFKRQLDKMIAARETHAAYETARFLIRNNEDFRGCSEIDLARAIMSKEEIKIHEISR